jgi:hypothetical protein
MNLTIDPAGRDPRLHPSPTEVPRRDARKPVPDRGTDAAHVTISSSAVTESWAATQVENVAAASHQVADLEHANEFVKQLAAQMAAQPDVARAAQAHVPPRTALNLLI